MRETLIFFSIAYFRSDFAELLAASIFPLAIHFALRCAEAKPASEKNERLRNIAWLGIVYAAIWLTNAPAAVVCSYALALLLVTCAALRRSWRPLFAGATALASGLLLAGLLHCSCGARTVLGQHRPHSLTRLPSR